MVMKYTLIVIAIMEQINNGVCSPINTHKGVTGSVFEEGGMMYVQKYLHGEHYYIPYNIYDNTEETVDILPHSTDTWLLCDNVYLLSENSNVKSDEEFEEWMLEDPHRIA